MASRGQEMRQVGVRAARDWSDAVRRNHALEHATVSVFLARHGPTRMAGRATKNGFFIIGDVDLDELRSCAEEALSRMQRGQASLAVSPLCGTNIAVSGLLAAGAATTVLSRGSGRFGNAFTAAMLGVIFSQPLGRLVQRHLTTRADVQDIELVGVRSIFGKLKKVDTRIRLAPPAPVA